MGTGAGKCKEDDCKNLTFSVFCYLHEDGKAARPSSPSQVKVRKLSLQSGKSAQIDGVPSEPAVKVWADTKRVFVDIQDTVSPGSIREQVRAYAEGAATTSALRFARDERMEVDAEARDKKIEKFIFETSENLLPHYDVVSQEDAEFIANAVPTDGLGGFGDYEDAKALIGYGIRKEWELANIEGLEESEDGIPYDIPYERFLSVVYSNDIAPHIVVALRREASDFHDNVVIATGKKAANPAAVAAKSALPSRAESEPITSAYFNEAREWIEKNRKDAEAQRLAQEEAERAEAERIKAKAEMIGAVIDSGANLVHGGIRAFAGASEFLHRVMQARPEDFEAKRRAENQRNRDIYYDMATRRERARRGLS